jgi:sporulation protein YtfJ
MNENVKAPQREKLSTIIENALESIKEISDVNTVVGDPIETAGGVTVIPISSLSLGFASGGVDGLGKQTTEKTKKFNFAGGGGTGIKINPVGFLVVKPSGDVSYLAATPAPKSDRLDTILDMIERSPELIKRLREALSKEKTESGSEDAE